MTFTVALNVYMPNLNSRDGMDGEAEPFSLFFFLLMIKTYQPQHLT